MVGRYKGIQGLLNTIGFGRWANGVDGEIAGGAIYLDRDFDKSSEQRRLLRTHELGHALGYEHVTARISIMNPAIGPEPTSFDRDGATLPSSGCPATIARTRIPTPRLRRPAAIFGIRGFITDRSRLVRSDFLKPPSH